MLQCFILFTDKTNNLKADVILKSEKNWGEVREPESVLTIVSKHVSL